jgi:hypothetical protein
MALTSTSMPLAASTSLPVPHAALMSTSTPHGLDVHAHATCGPDDRATLGLGILA